MKLNSHTKMQITALVSLVAIFFVVLLYSEGYFDLTFIKRPGSYSGAMNQQQAAIDSNSPSAETAETERPTPETESLWVPETQKDPQNTVDLEAIESEFNSKFEEMFQNQQNQQTTTEN